MTDEKDFQKRIKNVEDALKKALKDNELEMTTIIDVPKYRELPVSLKLALALLQEEGAIIIRKYEPIKKN